jgi:hypothetical protein
MPRFIKFPNLPQIPRHLWPDLDMPANGQEPLWHSTPRSATRGNDTIWHDQYAKFEISPELKSWVDTNICNSYMNIGLAFMFDGTTHLPHTDSTRDIAVLYVFDTGGDNVKTTFYKFKNSQEIHQENGCYPTSMDDLEEIEAVVLAQGTWSTLDSLVLHGVENKTRPRITLQLGFGRDNTWASDQLKL